MGWAASQGQREVQKGGRGSVPSTCSREDGAAAVREEACEQGAEQEPEAQAFFPAWPVLTPRPSPGKRSRSSLRFWKPVGWQVAQLQEASVDVEALAENR